MPSVNGLKTNVSEWPLGKVTATVGAPLADLSEINENLGVLTEAVEAKANNEKDSESTFIVSEGLTMIRGMTSILIEKLQVCWRKYMRICNEEDNWDVWTVVKYFHFIGNGDPREYMFIHR